MNITVAGTGYVGLVTGVCLASKGHHVTCVDSDEKKIQILNEHRSPIYEPGLCELMRKHHTNMKFTTDFQSSYKAADVIFIGVGTPEKSDGSANLSYVFQVAKQIAVSAEKDCVVVVKSTVPIGTNDRIESYIHDKKVNEVEIHVASNPEFLSQGTAVRDTLYASRVIIGVNNELPKKILKEVYKDFVAPKIIMERRSAEMVKYASNDFLALKISYINEIANLCEVVGADIQQVAEGMGHDPRIGNQFLSAGIGYGGSCFPKDTKALNWLANFNDNEIRTIRAAIEVNENQKFKLVKKAKKYYEDFLFLNVAILGCTFKPGTDDLREAPSLVNVPLFLEDGANVRLWDPVGKENFRREFPEKIKYCDSIEEALSKADLCLILTEWEEICKFDINKFKQLMRKPIVIDGRNCYALKAFENSGIIYDSIGRKTINVQSPRNGEQL